MTDDKKQVRSLKLLIIGAGAIGTYIGGSLAIQGHKVTFLETPGVVEELQERGLSLEIDGLIKRIPDPSLAASLEEALALGSYDVAIFALKSYDTRSAIDNLMINRSGVPPILCLQNGISNEALLSSAFGTENVIPGSVTSAVGRRAVGNIILERLRGVGIDRNHRLANTLATAFNTAGLNARLYSNPASMKWSKLITNLPANASSAILNLTPADIFSNPGLFQMEILQLREALAVMKAQNIPVVDLPGTPVRLFAFAIRSLPFWLSRVILKRAIGSGRGGKMPSFHIDLYSRRGKSEVVYLNGAIADEGEKLGIPTPVNRFLTDTLMALTQGEIPLNTYAQNPTKFLIDLQAQF